MVSVIAANTWRGCAFSMILQYAGAAARAARAARGRRPGRRSARWRRFRRRHPGRRSAPAVALNLALITIYTLNTFDLILPLTGGGPARATEVMSLFMYRSAFMSLEAGRAAAVAVVMLALNLALALAALRADPRGRGRCAVTKALAAPLGCSLLAALVPAAPALAGLAGAQDRAGRLRVPAAARSRAIRRSRTCASCSRRRRCPVYLWNSASVAVLATLVTLGSALPAAFVLSRERFRGPRGRAPRPAAACRWSRPSCCWCRSTRSWAALGLLDTHRGSCCVYAAVQLPFTITVLAGFFDALADRALRGGAAGRRLARAHAACRSRCRWSAPGPGGDRHLQPGRLLVRVRRWRWCCSIRSRASRSRSGSSACRAATRPSGRSWPRPA